MEGGAGGCGAGVEGGGPCGVFASSVSPDAGASASTLLPWLLRPLLLVEGALTIMVGMGMELFSTEPFPPSVPWAMRRSSTLDCFTSGPLPLLAPPLGPPAPGPAALRSVRWG